MNNIVETYLLFKANNVCSYIDIIAEELRFLSKVPKQLNKLIYKYYDLFVLSNRKFDYEVLKEKIGLDVSDDKTSLFYLLIEFDMASRLEYSNSEKYQFYNLIVNSILIFSELEREKTLDKNLNYDNALSKVLKKYIDHIDDDYMLLLDKLYVLLKKVYDASLKKEIKFKENYVSDVYDVYFSKIKHSNNFYLSKFRYKNDNLFKESKKDVSLINTEFLFDLDLINIEMLSIRLLEDSFSFDNRRVFVKISDEMLLKKINLNSLINLIKLRFLKEKIVIVVNTGILEKNEEKVTYLIEKGFNIAYFKDSGLVSYDVYKQGGYLFVLSDENLKACMKFAKTYGLEIIVSKGNKRDSLKLNNVMYVS